MSLIRVSSRIHDYEIRFESDLAFLRELAARPNAAFIADRKVLDAHRDALGEIASRAIPFDAHEEAKSIDGAIALWQTLLERQAKKNLTLVSIGGGIVQDVTGFVASTLYRGIRWVYVPTTLLAQADSCLGSKTSLNFRGWKNLLGTFYPPHEIHLAPAFLASLGDADIASGLGEVVKLALMAGPKRVDELVAAWPRLVGRDPAALLAAIRRSLEIKLGFLEGDEFDGGRRNLLNYGHCVGHALETATSFAVPHGQAVVAGMLAANEISVARGRLARAAADSIARDVLLPAWIVRPARAQLAPAAIVDGMGKDKKRTGAGLAVILLEAAHAMTRVDDVTPSEVERALSAVEAML